MNINAYPVSGLLNLHYKRMKLKCHNILQLHKPSIASTMVRLQIITVFSLGIGDTFIPLLPQVPVKSLLDSSFIDVISGVILCSLVSLLCQFLGSSSAAVQLHSQTLLNFAKSLLCARPSLVEVMVTSPHCFLVRCVACTNGNAHDHNVAESQGTSTKASSAKTNQTLHHHALSKRVYTSTQLHYIAQCEHLECIFIRM